MSSETETETDRNQPDKVSRRGFITGAAAATAVAAATGAGLAVYNGQSTAAVVTPTPVSALTTGQAAAVTNTTNAAQQQALTQLASAQAENLRLKAELDAALRQIEIADQSQGAANEELTLLRAELQSSTEQAGLFAGLIGLYEQLDQLDIGDTVESGLNTVSAAFGELIDDLPTLSEGLDSAEEVLAQFESQVPAFTTGLDWMSEQISRLTIYHGDVDVMLQRALDAAGPILELLQQWFDDILGWLPFGMGSKAQQVMIAITNLVRETPNTIEGSQRLIAAPMDGWFKPEVGEVEPAIKSRLFSPVREKTINSTRKAMEKIHTTQTNFQQELVTKTAGAITDRRQMQSLIRQYRDQHGL